MDKKLFSTQIYKDVFAFALKAHNEQKTPEGLPYSFHIVSVALEVINSLSHHSISYDEANIAICCALLHDVNEDTNVRVTTSLHVENIDVVIKGVQALTKDETLPSKQAQMRDSLERLKQQPKCVQMVKLADRITNLAPAPNFWNKAKRESYVKEAKMILEALKDSNPYLAKKLRDKIENYEVEKGDNFLAFYSDKKQLVLDKNHSKYLKTFKAINRLNSYVKKEYDLELFSAYLHVENENGMDDYEKVNVSYIVKVLNTKDLLDLNKQTDETIAKYMSVIYEGLE